MELDIQANKNLSCYNSFGFAAVADHFVSVSNIDELKMALAFAKESELPWLVIGGGSNLIVASHVPGLVIHMAFRGITSISEGSSQLVSIAAGENWHQLVEHCVTQGWGGIENLALIPGTAGAAPMQNIGAYGTELADVFDSLTALDTQTGGLRTFDREQCCFGYRDSYFKSVEPGRFIIVEIKLRLIRDSQPDVSYGALAAELEKKAIKSPSIQDIFTAVCDIRRSKLPDPADIGNAGSFFKNPVVSEQQFDQLSQQFPNIVSFPVADGRKLAAGWLIDQCGLKGLREGNVGVYAKQALVLVNHGEGNAEELLVLADKVADTVKGRFGVMLEIEPRQIP